MQSGDSTDINASHLGLTYLTALWVPKPLTYKHLFHKRHQHCRPLKALQLPCSILHTSYVHITHQTMVRSKILGPWFTATDVATKTGFQCSRWGIVATNKGLWIYEQTTVPTNTAKGNRDYIMEKRRWTQFNDQKVIEMTILNWTKWFIMQCLK